MLTPPPALQHMVSSALIYYEKGTSAISTIIMINPPICGMGNFSLDNTLNSYTKQEAVYLVRTRIINVENLRTSVLYFKVAEALGTVKAGRVSKRII